MHDAAMMDVVRRSAVSLDLGTASQRRLDGIDSSASTGV
jgi:hypothetical protein